MKFEDYAFSEKLKSGIEKAQFVECTPVQEKTFNFILEGRDVYAQSQTGTGKTAAFLISIFHLLQDEKYKGRKALVVVPTRELAVQIKEEADVLGQDLDFKVGCFFGGTGYKKQEEILEKGVDVVVATPGRLLDFSKQKKINFEDFSLVVIDEADRLFDMGFVDDIRRIFNSVKNNENRITLLFSATMNPNVGNISWEYMNNPGEIFIEPEQLTVDAIDQELYHISKDEKINFLLGVLKKENADSVIIFTNTKHMAYEISKRLEKNGYPNKYIMGDLPQSKRLRVVNDVKSGKVKYLVATDVAARGLHIDDLALVVNYDLPIDSENYVHRIGRTARAGKTGKAISLACENFVYNLQGIEDYIENKIPVCHATDDMFIEDVSAGERFSLREKGHGRGHSDRRHSDRGHSDRRHSDRKHSDRKGNNSRNRKRPNDKERLSRVRNQVMNISGSHSMDADFKSDKPKKKSHKGKPHKKGNSNKKAGYNKNYNKPKDLKRVSSGSKVEDRLEYYKKKYGEDFKVSSSPKSTKKNSSKQAPKTPGKKVQKKGLLSRIKSIFK